MVRFHPHLNQFPVLSSSCSSLQGADKLYYERKKGPKLYRQTAGQYLLNFILFTVEKRRLKKVNLSIQDNPDSDVKRVRTAH